MGIAISPGKEIPYRSWKDPNLLPCPCCGKDVQWYDLNQPIDQGQSINQEDPAIICTCGMMAHCRNQLQTREAWNKRCHELSCICVYNADGRMYIKCPHCRKTISDVYTDTYAFIEAIQGSPTFFQCPSCRNKVYLNKRRENVFST